MGSNLKRARHFLPVSEKSLDISRLVLGIWGIKKFHLNEQIFFCEIWEGHVWNMVLFSLEEACDFSYAKTLACLQKCFSISHTWKYFNMFFNIFLKLC